MIAIYLGNNSKNQHKILNKKRDEDSPLIEHAEKVIEDVLGSGCSNDARPLFVKNRTLTITCSTQEIALAVRDAQQEIVDKINDKLGKKELDRIRYLI